MAKKLLFLFFFYYSSTFSSDKMDAQLEAMQILNHGFERSMSKLKNLIPPISNFIKNTRQQELTIFKKLLRNKIEILSSLMTNRVADLKLIEQSLISKLTQNGQQLYKTICSAAKALNQTSSVIGASNIAFESELLLSGIIKLLDEPTFAHATIISLQPILKSCTPTETSATAKVLPTEAKIIKREHAQESKMIEKAQETKKLDLPSTDIKESKVENPTEYKVEKQTQDEVEFKPEVEFKSEVELKPEIQRSSLPIEQIEVEEFEQPKEEASEPIVPNLVPEPKTKYNEEPQESDLEIIKTDEAAAIEPQIESIIDVNEYIQQDAISKPVDDAQLLKQKEDEWKQFLRE